jgi:hypothetical protein
MPFKPTNVARAAAIIATLLGASAPAFAQNFKIDLGFTNDPAPDPSYTATGIAGVWNKRTGDPVESLVLPLIDASGVAHSNVTFSVNRAGQAVNVGGGSIGSAGDDFGGPYLEGDYAYFCPADPFDYIMVQFDGLENGIYEVELWAPKGTGAPLMMVTQDLATAGSSDYLPASYMYPNTFTTLVTDGQINILGYQPDPRHLGASCIGLAGIELERRDLTDPLTENTEIDFGLAFGAPEAGYNAALWGPGTGRSTGGVWNRVGAAGTSVPGAGPLVDFFGQPNGLSVSFSGTGLDSYAATPITSTFAPWFPDLVGDYISGASGWSMRLAGLQPAAFYTLTVYAPANATADSLANLTLNGVPQPTEKFAPGMSFLQVSGQAAGDGSMTLATTPNGTTPTAIAGMQVRTGDVVDHLLSCGPSNCRQGGMCAVGMYQALRMSFLCSNTPCPDGVPILGGRCFLPIDFEGHANCMFDPNFRYPRHFAAPSTSVMTSAQYNDLFNRDLRKPDGKNCTDASGAPVCTQFPSCDY